MRTRITALSGLPFIVVGILAAAARIAAAQTLPAAAPLPPAKPPITEKAREKAVPAKLLFGAKALPSLGKSAAITQPQLGAPQPRPLYREICLAGGEGDRMERHPCW